MSLQTVDSTPRNRHGKKRRTRATGSRTATGRVRQPSVDPRALVAAQPHRNWLPESLRLSEKASSVIGCMNLMRVITDEQYEAGRRYGVIVAAYRVAIGTPNGVSGNGRGYACAGLGCVSEACECLARQTRYQRAYEAVSDAGGQAHLAVNRVVIGEELIHARDLGWLRAGLDALVGHFGIGR